MLPVTIALGLINFELLINSFFGTLVSDQAPAAIDKAFRIYMLPQGLFCVAIATILFPTLSRFAARGAFDDLRRTMANGVAPDPAAADPERGDAWRCWREPITRLVYQRGAFGAEATDLVSTAMVWWAISLPVQGVSLLFSRTFFSLQRPWVTTRSRGRATCVVNAVVSARALQAARHRGHRDRHVVGTVVMALVAGLDPAPRACAASRAGDGRSRRADARRPRRCSRASAYGVWYGARRRCSAARCLAQVVVGGRRDRGRRRRVRRGGLGDAACHEARQIRDCSLPPAAA